MNISEEFEAWINEYTTTMEYANASETQDMERAFCAGRNVGLKWIPVSKQKPEHGKIVLIPEEASTIAYAILERDECINQLLADLQILSEAIQTAHPDYVTHLDDKPKLVSCQCPACEISRKYLGGGE